MIVCLPQRWVERLGKILASIPIHQKRTSRKKSHKVLGKLCSLSLAMPGAWRLFSHIQQALSKKIEGRVSLKKDMHQALEEICWLFSDITSRPTQLAKLIFLAAAAKGHHDASDKGAGGIWFPSPSLKPREGYTNKPVVRRMDWP